MENCCHGRSGNGYNSRIYYEYINNNCFDNHCNYHHQNLRKYSRMNKTFRCHSFHTNGRINGDNYSHHNNHYQDETHDLVTITQEMAITTFISEYPSEYLSSSQIKRYWYIRYNWQMGV